jgi:hypothetical protein
LAHAPKGSVSPEAREQIVIPRAWCGLFATVTPLGNVPNKGRVRFPRRARRRWAGEAKRARTCGVSPDVDGGVAGRKQADGGPPADPG